MTRDVVDGRWAVPAGTPESTLGEGLWALPGLVDGHAHFAAVERVDWITDDVAGATRRASEALTAGVMLALDKGWNDLTTIEMMNQVGLETGRTSRRPGSSSRSRTGTGRSSGVRSGPARLERS